MTSASRHVATATGPAVHDGRVLGLTRAGIWVLFVLAAANGLFLYLVPGRAATDYAWSIKPAVNAAFIGAGFLAGTLATGLVLWRATRWRSFSLLPPALWVLATTLLAATIIHHDRFKWHYAPTWVWALVYAGVPLAIPVLVARQQRMAEALPAPDPALLVLRVLSGIIGAGLIAGAVALYFTPVELGEHWLWPLTPLLARAVARGVRNLVWRAQRRWLSDRRVGFLRVRVRNAAAWWFRCCTCCLGVRWRWPRCVSARRSSRSSRSWCFATSLGFFGARLLGRGLMSVIGCSSLRPAGC